MKTLLSILFSVLMALGMSSSSNPISKDGTYKGKKLVGSVRIVNGIADFDVRIVKSLADLNVRFVESNPKEVGEWRIVNGNANFTIRIVESNPDFTIRIVDSFPGVQ